MQQNHIQKLTVSDLKPSQTHAKVYSTISAELLAASMLQHGQLEPIIVNQSNTIISGVLRWQIAK